jgi:uncharacterized protein YukE
MQQYSGHKVAQTLIEALGHMSDEIRHSGDASRGTLR